MSDIGVFLNYYWLWWICNGIIYLDIFIMVIRGEGVILF